MKPRHCYNLEYRNQREIKIMKKMHIRDGDIQAQLRFVDIFSPRERQFTCGRCPSDGLCRFLNRYGERWI